MTKKNIILIIVLTILLFITTIIGFRIVSKENFKNKLQVIYTPSNQENDWEADYIKNDLCKDMDTVFMTLDKVQKYVEENPHLKNNHIFVFTSGETKYEDLLKIVIDIKPLIIIHLSDEWGTIPEYTYLTSKAKLVLRQHNFKGYNIKYYNNVYHIPLGYITKMLNDESSTDRTDIPLITDRKYTWSFVGNHMKQDRYEMIDKFKAEFPNYYQENTSAENMFEIYKKTIFVLNGRGNVSINCFRVYEAAVAGAIPVVVGDWEELKDTFNLGNHENIINYNNIPPFIYEKNWDDAVIKCKWLLENPAMLEEMQKQILLWWNNIVKDIQYQIQKVIENNQT